MSDQIHTDSSTKRDDLIAARLQYLKAKTDAVIRQSKRGWIWHMGPTLGGVLTSLTAGVILFFFSGEIAKEFVAGAREAREERNRLETYLGALRDSVANEEAVLARFSDEIRAHDDVAVQQGGSHGVLGMAIRIVDDGPSYRLDVTTQPAGAQISAFSDCPENLVFPNEKPHEDDCAVHFNVYSLANRQSTLSPCSVGPIAKFGTLTGAVWVRAEFGDTKVYKYVHLTGS